MERRPLVRVVILYLHPLLGEGLARDPRRGPIDIRLPSNETRRLRLRQLGRTRTWFWSVDELQIWARP